MLRRVVPVLMVAGLLGACAQESYDSRRTVDDLVDVGLSRAEATCVVREMNDRIKVERLGAREEPGADERAKFAALLDECVPSESGSGSGSGSGS